MTLGLENDRSKLLDVVSVADVGAKERVVDSLVEILNLSFGHDIEAGVWSRFSSIFWSRL